jgi:hypothetical protein
LTHFNLRKINDFLMFEVENPYQCFASITTKAAKTEEDYPFASTTSSTARTPPKNNDAVAKTKG